MDPALVDALVVPGGDATHAVGNGHVRALIQHLDTRNALLAAICGGPAALGDAGALDSRRYTASLEPTDATYPGVQGRGSRVPKLVVTDDHVATAVGSAHLAFAEEGLHHLDDASAVEPLDAEPERQNRRRGGGALKREHDRRYPRVRTVCTPRQPVATVFAGQRGEGITTTTCSSK